MNDKQEKLIKNTSLTLTAVELTNSILSSTDIKVDTLDDYFKVARRVQDEYFKDIEEEINAAPLDKGGLRVVDFNKMDS